MQPDPAAGAAGADVALLPVDPALAALIVAGEPAPVPHAADWPHADTADGLRSVVDGGASAWLVAAEGIVVGDAGTAGPPDADGVVEIGYGLAPARGRGIGGAAVRLVADRALGLPGARRVRAHVLADNVPSRRALERAGFALAGVDGVLRYERAPGGAA